MLHKYLILIALSVGVISVVGQNDYRNIFRNLLDMTMHSNTWKIEIEETLTDKVVERLETKLTDILEARLVFNFEKALEERLVLKLEQRLAKKVEESLERKMEIKLEKILAKNLENKLEGKLENKLESKLETKLALSLEDKLAQSFELKLAGKVEEKIASKLEQKVTEKLEKVLERKLEDTLKVQLEKTLEEKLAPKLEEKLAENLEEKLAIKFEPYLGVKVAANLDKKLTESLQLLLRENLEKKLNEIDTTYRRQREQDKVSQTMEWVKTKPKEAFYSLRDRALVAGYDYDGSQLWIIRGYIENNLVPGKLNKHVAAVAWKGKEIYLTDEIEVFCAPKERVKWVASRNGDNAVPSCAVDAGKTAAGHTLYVGRAILHDTWVPGMVNPESGLLIPYESEEITRIIYEVLCLV